MKNWISEVIDSLEEVFEMVYKMSHSGIQNPKRSWQSMVFRKST